MPRKLKYTKPYADILGTAEQEAIEIAMREISPNYVMYDESQMLVPEYGEKLKKITGKEEPLLAVRELLRTDKTFEFEGIPEHWHWLFYCRLLWNFGIGIDPYFEVKNCVWLRCRGKMMAVNQWGSQNCLGGDVEVLMHDGSRKRAKNVEVGDILMGPDSTPRQVLVLHQGTAPLYRISPKMGDDWICTGNHKLELEDFRGGRVKVMAQEVFEGGGSWHGNDWQQVHVDKGGKTRRTPIEVEKLESEGDFFGWTVDQDNMFLLGDGCITNNSGKTFHSGRFPVVQLTVWGSDCIAFISGPYKTHSTDKTWREVKKACSALPLTPAQIEQAFGFRWDVQSNEVRATSKDGYGFIKFVAAQEASSVQGGKSDEHQEDGRRGISFFSVDEFIENPNMDLDESFGNYRSNFNSFTLLSCNPKPEKVQAPSLLSFADPISIPRSKLRRNVDFRWRTRKGEVVRFSWDNCPNKILNRTEYPYLMNETRKQVQSNEDEHIRAAQLEAWGWGAEGSSTLTDSQRQVAAQVFAKYHKESNETERFISFDPAFGGSDPAVYTILDTAKVNVGSNTRRRFVGVEQNTIPGIDSDFVADAAFMQIVDRIISYRHNVLKDKNTEFLSEIYVGKPLGPMAQGAVLAADICITKGIPFTHATFDASQRADCADWMFKVFGRSSNLWYYEGSRRLIQEEGDDWFRWPYKSMDDRRAPGNARHQKWSDYCGRVITMIWAFACELINNGYLIDGDAVQRGLDELGAREVASTASGKVDVWSKQDIKRGTFQGKKIPKMSSPAWAETLAICMYFATRFHSAVDIGSRPELATHSGSSPVNDDAEWLELAGMY